MIERALVQTIGTTSYAEQWPRTGSVHPWTGRSRGCHRDALLAFNNEWMEAQRLALLRVAHWSRPARMTRPTLGLLVGAARHAPHAQAAGVH
jgi:hypothetical protein